MWQGCIENPDQGLNSEGFYIIIILSPNIVSASDLKEEFGLKYIEKDDWDKLKENL